MRLKQVNFKSTILLIYFVDNIVIYNDMKIINITDFFGSILTYIPQNFLKKWNAITQNEKKKKIKKTVFKIIITVQRQLYFRF